MISEVKPSEKTMRVRNEALKKDIANGSPDVIQRLLYAYIDRRTRKSTIEVVKVTRAPYKNDHFYVQPITIQAADIFLSLSEVLFSDVSMVDNIQGENLAALKEFLRMLISLLPASDHYLHKLNELSRWVDKQTSFTGSQWSDYLVNSNFPKYSGQYDLCRSTLPKYHGYPCGLWLMFHALTVSHYEKSATGMDLPVDIVAHAMNRFIPRFFSCQICAFHFAENSANIVHPGESILPPRASPDSTDFTYNASVLKELPPPPKDARTEILWLNAVHNRVNRKLMGSPTDDPFAPKLIYPPRWLCSTCWSRTRASYGRWKLGGDDESQTALLDFLIRRFSSSGWGSNNISSIFFGPRK
ncbi:Sulfhydryl oxidase [Fasciola gigantica]|uniref:Sulfhydryl oxidase n=1 Tax=Fasciola gigantica TaxID=46835 RepID=A0A504YJG2_FASGI|nr:Sulfhydryl oxidase [Fasciola gigantica]